MTVERVPRVLFVCRGNMERSPMAEGYYNHLSRIDLAISAGVIDISQWYPSPPPQTTEIMREVGIDISEHRVKKVTIPMLIGIKRIYIFCEPETCPLFLRFSPIPTVYHHIDDPYQQPRHIVIKIRDQIHEFVESIIQR